MIHTELVIRWSSDSQSRFKQLMEAIGTLRRWEVLWRRTGIADIIKDNIKRNMDQGIDPDLKTWPLLSPSYAARVHRPRMLFSQTSNAYGAYVYSPIISYGENEMTYSPNPGLDDAHYSFLRGGWIDWRSGKAVPGREWFGISDDYLPKMEVAMARVVAGVMEGVKK